MRHRVASISVLSLLAGIVQLPLAAQSLQVNSANPIAAPQGTINLDVAIGGSGFKRGAQSQFFVTGTTNPGGVTVNSTAFVSSNQLSANITVADTATIASFDITVRNSDGRTGKGTGLFSVVSNGNSPICALTPLPSQFSLVTTLNSSAPTYTGLGSSIRIRHVTLGGKDVLVAGVGTTAAGGSLQVFFIDPITGTVLDGTIIGNNTAAQPHVTKPVTLPNGSTIGMRVMAMGDVNGDGIPDIAVAGSGMAVVFVGHVDGNGIMSYSDQITFPAASGQSAGFGAGLAMGNLDGVAGDEVAVADPGSGTGGKARPGGVFIYRFNGSGLTLAQSVNQAAAGVAIGDVSGDSNQDLIVGASNVSSIFVYPGPSFSNRITMPPGPAVRAAYVNGGSYADLIAAPGTGINSSGAPKQVNIFAGPVFAGEQPEFSLFPLEVNDMDTGDINGDGMADLFIGAPNTSPSNACPTSVGTAYIYLTNAATPNQPTIYALEPPTPDVDFGAYGWSPGAANGTRIFLVGEIGRNINGVANAGQVYVYKVN